jgi:hypothetical protein
MLRTGNTKFYILAALAVVALLGVSSAVAQSFPDTYQVNYYSNAHTTGAPDGKVRVDNPGTNNGTDLCADVYVFDNTEELIECCGCNLTPDGLRTFSINADLTANPANGFLPTTGVVKIISALQNPNAAHPSWGKCDPTGGFSFTNNSGNIAPTADLRAWATHIQNRGPSGAFPATAEEFQDSTLATWELAYLQKACFGIRQLGSGRGVCHCGTGD